MTYSAVYEAKRADDVRCLTIERRSLEALFDAVKLQVSVDFVSSPVEAIAIFISETPANGQT